MAMQMNEVVRANKAVKGLKALAPLSGQLEDGRYMMSVEEAKKIKVYRSKDKGYQRDLNLKRVDEITNILKKSGKSTFSEIVVANVRGEMQCVDGQHRLVAHIAAGVPIAVHVLSMTQEEAIDRFIRDNAKARPLRRTELILASRDPIAVAIRSLCKTWGLHLTQAIALTQGLIGQRALLYLDGSYNIDERQGRVMDVLLQRWTNDSRFRENLVKEIRDNKSRKAFAGSTERAFSHPNTFWLLGQLARDNIMNINKIKADVDLLLEADWSSRNIASLRVLAIAPGNGARKALRDFVERKILLPAYKNK
jgi:hypothetical protein